MAASRQLTIIFSNSGSAINEGLSCTLARSIRLPATLQIAHARYGFARCQRTRRDSGLEFRRTEPQLNSRRLRQWKTLLLATFTLLFLAEADLVIRQERTQIFAATAQKAGSKLIDFAEARGQLLQRKPNESFEQYEQRISTENADTQSLYSKLYSLEVARLRDGLARRGLKTPEIDEFYQRPGSVIAMREIGRALFDMGTELRSEHFSTVVKGWLRRLIHLALFSRFQV